MSAASRAGSSDLIRASTSMYESEPLSLRFRRGALTGLPCLLNASLVPRQSRPEPISAPPRNTPGGEAALQLDLAASSLQRPSCRLLQPATSMGVSEYQNKYRGGRRRVKSASPRCRMRLAGLRSDQQGISKEPQFQSKRKVPFYPPQVSRSLQWGASAGPPRQQDTTRCGSSPAARASSAERVETPLAPRASKPPRTSKTSQHDEEAPCAQVSRSQQQQEKTSNGIKHVLRKKSGLRSERQRNGHHGSEYQRQFLSKTPVTESPLLTAQQMLYTSNQSIPPFKSNPVEMESEYKRNFKGSPPPRPPRLRRDVELNEVPQFQWENRSPEKSKKKRKEQHLNRRTRPNEETHPEPKTQQQEAEAPRKQNHVSPKVMRKVKTEYTTNFRSPLQYRYSDGAWVRSKTLEEEAHEWYHEVRDLREKAEAYRRRAWGTHFSRQHLSQILSEQNCLWEATSASSSTLSEQDNHSSNSPVIEALDLARMDSVRGSSSPGASVSLSTSRRSSFEGVGLSNGPTLPALRKPAWEEEASPCERGVAEIKQQREKLPVQQPRVSDEEEDMNEHSENKRENMPESEPLSPASVSGSSEGRLPTPKLKIMLTPQRTHHDRTTPTTGGAILVSPPKTKKSSSAARRSEAPLGKVHSPYKHLSHSPPPRPQNKAENGSLPCSSPTAGMATVDPFPMREDAWSVDSPEPAPEQKPARTFHNRSASAKPITSFSPRASRIQGTLRNPEFQHNGNLGLHRPELFVFPSSGSCASDNDGRMSQLSYRSAASCSMASQVLDRAQRRKEDFWGKS